MTEEQTPEQTEEEQFVPLPLEQLTAYIDTTGLPVVVANTPDIRQHMDANGHDMYYILGYAEEKKPGVASKTTYRPAVFRVVSNIIGKSIVEVGIDELALDTFTENAMFSLPPIPNHIRQKLDDFFRMVAEMYGTEAIAILTYDPSFNDGAGWGILVPKQENTGAHCSYDQESVVEDKPDHVYIVGTAHSHPNMSAYASGTDHHDQADFDGLHITYGWSTKTSGQTEYYAELQLAGETYKISPDIIFEQAPREPVSPEVETWAKERVSKKVTTTAPKSGGGTLTPLPTQTQTKTTGTHGTGTQGSAATSNTHKITVPDGCPPLASNTVIAVIDSEEPAPRCPFCDVKLVSLDMRGRRCVGCKNYFVMQGESVRDLLEIRKGANSYSYDIDLDHKAQIDKPIFMWYRDGGKDRFTEEFWPENLPRPEQEPAQGKS